MTEAECYFTINRAYWDERVPTHVRSAFYDVDGFKAGRITIDPWSLEAVGKVEGKSLLHLQCHFGMDTLSWARLGADATGVDFSPPAIVKARELSDEIGVPARFIEANIYDLPNELDGEFDVVFTSWGTIVWLPDIRGWAQVIGRFLKPGGRFVFVDAHPSMFMLDYRVEDQLVFGFDYFSDIDDPDIDDFAASYADPSSSHANTASAQWNHSLGSILTALAEAGLKIELVREEPVCAWQYHPLMTQGDDGYWRLPESYPKLPLLLAIRAIKAS